jgi:ABC-type multidrug transport system fused ATPase/permease subunit
MNKLLPFCLCVTILFSVNHLSQGQDSLQQKGSLKSGTIDSQFEYIYDVSNNFQEYKVVKQTNLDLLKSNILDSMKTMRSSVGDLNLIIDNQKDSIGSLNQVLSTSETEKQQAIAEKDNFSFLGIGIYKVVYSTFMWILVAILAAALAFFSFQYTRSYKKIRKAQRDLEEIQEELDSHRKTMLDRERKLKRELIDAQMGK